MAYGGLPLAWRARTPPRPPHRIDQRPELKEVFAAVPREASVVDNYLSIPKPPSKKAKRVKRPPVPKKMSMMVA